MLAFTFEASIGKVVKEVGAHVGVVGDEALDGAATEGVAAVEGVATKKSWSVQAAEEYPSM